MGLARGETGEEIHVSHDSIPSNHAVRNDGDRFIAAWGSRSTLRQSVDFARRERHTPHTKLGKHLRRGSILRAPFSLLRGVRGGPVGGKHVGVRVLHPPMEEANNVHHARRLEGARCSKPTPNEKDLRQAGSVSHIPQQQQHPNQTR